MCTPYVLNMVRVIRVIRVVRVIRVLREIRGVKVIRVIRLRGSLGVHRGYRMPELPATAFIYNNIIVDCSVLLQ